MTRIPYEAANPRGHAQHPACSCWRHLGSSRRLVRDLQVDDPGPGTSFHMVTGVREHEGRIWMGSLHEPAVALLEP